MAAVATTRRLANRLALAATTLTLAFVLAIGGFSYRVTRDQLIGDQESALANQARQFAGQTGDRLRSIVTTLGGLTDNALILNSLMDSLTRQTALVPFLADFSQVNEVPLSLAVTDFEGRPIAGNVQLAAAPEDWRGQVLTTGRPFAALRSEPDSDILFVAHPIFYSRTLSPEGALLYQVRLAHIGPAAPELAPGSAHLRLVQGAEPGSAPDPGGTLLRRLEVLPVPPVLQPLGLAAEVSMDRGLLTASLERLTTAYTALGLGMIVLVFGLARAGAQHLTQPLRALEAVVRSVIDSGSLDHRLAPQGIWELERLGQAFNQMLERLDGAHRRVRQQAEIEAERGEALALANEALGHEVREREFAEASLARTIQELRLAEQQQSLLLAQTRREQGRLRALLEAMSVGILFEDRQQRVEYLNPAFLRMWDIDETLDLVGQPLRELLNHSANRFARQDHASRYVLQVLDTREITERFEIQLYDGRVLTQIAYPVMDHEERCIGRLWIYEDITNERQTAQQLLYLAERDPLTGLYNRHSFQRQLEQRLAASHRSGEPFAVIYFDLDDFKTINDTFGHRAGDLTLVRTANEISTQLRGAEMFARLGGDEFAILVSLASSHDPGALPARIVSTVSAIPFRFRGTHLRLTASVGIAVYPEHGIILEDLVAHADMAMYQAKNQGKNSWAEYDPHRHSTDAMIQRLNWNSRIAEALAQDRFDLHYQGVYHTDDQRLSHLEVLIRMDNPDDPSQPILPGQFIHVAEKSGQVMDIDRWVLKESIARLGRNPELPPLAVNISGRTFDDPTLPQFIQRLLAEQGVDPGRLFVELTETAAVSDFQDAQRFIEAIQQVGCDVCLDDFGSGFSTFAYLKYLNVKVLKIDGMFVRDLPNNRDNQVFIRAMVEVARGLHKATVAEFVEDAATLAMLRDLGVDLAQGYYLDRPSAHHQALAA